MSHVRAVFFDLGETLLDETRLWGTWADRLGIPRFTFFAALGAVIERGHHHLSVFEVLGVGAEQLEAAAAKAPANETPFLEEDFYPDARTCLETLRAAGYRTGIAGNQPAPWAERLRGIGLPVDVIGCSGEWGVEKPSAEFFAKVIDAAGAEPHEVAYVGDRVDNDVLPAAEAGMVAVFLRRGPWGLIHASKPEAARATIRIESLKDLPEALGRCDS